jgi:hypothetical protein
MATEKWFAVQSIFLIEAGAVLAERGQAYEDRITLWPAATAEEAVEKARIDSERYASENGYDQIDHISTYKLFDPTVDGAEVWSVTGESWLDPENYVERFVDEEISTDA